jgi:hypothetical protein
VIGSLEFVGLGNDIHTIESFAQHTPRIEKLLFGNRQFKLFTDAKIEDLDGIKVRKDAICPETDHANLRTLVLLLKKSRIVSLARLEFTWPILHVILNNVREFPNIQGLEIECDVIHSDLLALVADRISHQLTMLTLTEDQFHKGKGTDWFMNIAH